MPDLFETFGPQRIKSVVLEEIPQPFELPGVSLPRKVVATFENGAVGSLFTYYADELTFTEDEFVGLTVRQAVALWMQRDQEYLRS